MHRENIQPSLQLGIVERPRKLHLSRNDCFLLKIENVNNVQPTFKLTLDFSENALQSELK